MNLRTGGIAIVGLTVSLACGMAGAQDLGKLGGLVSGGKSSGSGSALGSLGGLGNLSSSSKGNVAGLLQYCVQNNYLGGGSGAAGIKDKLMGSLGGGGGDAGSGSGGSKAGKLLGKLGGGSSTDSSEAASNDPGFASGAKGILQGSNGSTLDLNALGGGNSDLKSKLTQKACDQVLKQGKSLI